MRATACCNAAVLALALATNAIAQTAAGGYPSRPLRLVIGFAAGGPADIFGRVIAQKLGELTGQPIIVEPRVGAGGILAGEYVAKLPADGYSFYLASSAVL